MSWWGLWEKSVKQDDQSDYSSEPDKTMEEAVYGRCHKIADEQYIGVFVYYFTIKIICTLENINMYQHLEIT